MMILGVQLIPKVGKDVRFLGASSDFDDSKVALHLFS